MFKFGFDNCDKIVELSEEEIHRIPYLSSLISHKDDFLSIKNDKNEYILHHPICYNLLIPILNSINNEKPYSLLNDLSVNENIFDVLQLFDYVCLNQPIFLSDRNRFFTYYPLEKNLCEVRNNAARFVLSLTRNEHNLNDFGTIEYIFSLISVIFSNKNIFSSQFRYHTYTILEEYIFPLFFKKHPIYLLNDITQNHRTDSNIYLCDDNQMVPIDCENDFVWKGYYEDKINNIIQQSYIMMLGGTRVRKCNLPPRRLYADRMNELLTYSYNLLQKIKETERLLEESILGDNKFK
ncbi:unnamed protein product [Adineta steineri]|uniref:Uncharacterized protein n=1 Tax=Adineta steineri TaxID=433720 RepID=A0A818UVM3_9BILA|nr:unnamed protein product [Adineta steineri]CAF3702353.1 unnamed protein product [Adineta steineri]